MVSQHSVDTFLDLMKETEKYEIVLALSPQSLASLTTSLQTQSDSLPKSLIEAFYSEIGPSSSEFGMPEVRDFCWRLLRSRGVTSHPLLDTTWSRDICLMAAAEEFVNVFKSDVDTPKLPVLTGICPGWVCYAEKTHFKLPSITDDVDESFLLKHISRVRSPQQLLAGVLKGVPTNCRLFLVFVMPCYDKKLEASRSEFTVIGDDSQKEADLVLGTNEFVSVLEALLSKPVQEPMDDSSAAESLDERLVEFLILIVSFVFIGCRIFSLETANYMPCIDMQAQVQAATHLPSFVMQLRLYSISNCRVILPMILGSLRAIWAIMIFRYFVIFHSIIFYLLFHIDVTSIQQLVEQSSSFPRLEMP